MIKESWYEIDEAKKEVCLYGKDDVYPSNLYNISYNYERENLSEVIKKRIKIGPIMHIPEITECLKIARDELLERGLIEE